MNLNKLRILSNLFSANFFNYILNNTHLEYLHYILSSSGYNLPKSKKHLLLSEFLDQVYEELFSNYRFEYIYKNTIINQILIERHSFNSSILLSEFRSSVSKADIVILNGTSTVYEIKTKLDKLDRLSSQLASYNRLFDKAYIVTYEENIPKINQFIDDRAGIIVLSNDHLLTELKPAKSNLSNVAPSIIFDSFRKNEYLNIIKTEFGYVPDVPNTKIFDECKYLFSTLTPEKAHNHMITVLKSRDIPNYQKNLIQNASPSLRMFCLFKHLSLGECDRLKLALCSSI